MKKIMIFVGFVLAPLVTACSTASILNFTIPRSGYAITKDIPFGSNPRNKLDVYIPENLTGPAPVVLFFYGGGWKKGKKEDYLFVGQALASKGFVTFVADYRLYPEVMFPGFVEDAALALRFVHAHAKEYGGDPDAIFLMGHSAGAYNALMLAMNGDYVRAAGARPEWIRGAIGIAGPYDFLPITDEGLKPVFAVPDQRLTQPITFASADAPPVLLLSGDEDNEVALTNTHNLANKLTGLNRSVETHIYPGVGHVGIVLSLARGFRGNAPTLEHISAFIRRHSQK